MKKRVTGFVIDRRIWMRGYRAGQSNELLNLYGGRRQQCCVGIYLSRCGVPDDVLRERQAASDLVHKLVPRQARWLVYDGDRDNPPLAQELYNANDDPMDEEHREKLVRSLFAKAGITVRFRG